MPRGRPKKVQTTTKVNNDFTLESTENKWKKLFASNSGAMSNLNGGTLNNFFMNTGSMFVNDPYLLNQRVKQLKTMSGFLNRDEIEQALLSPEFNEFVLRTATHNMLNMTYPLYKLQMLYEGILTYHSYVFPKYVDKKEFKTPRFKSDDKFMDMWIKKLNPQKQFRRITAEIIPEGKRAYYLRQSYNSKTSDEQVDYVHFQDLPSDWYRIIKKSTNSHYCIAFNFAYFWQAGTSLGQFPAIFSEFYSEMMGATEVDQYNNITGINNLKTPEDVVIEYNHQTMKWFYWKELPDDECFVFSFDESHALQVSPFISLLLPSQDLASYSLLQQQLLSVPLYSIILGEIPLHDDKGTKIQDYDAYQLSPDAKLLFESTINSQMPPGTSFSMTPSVNNTLYKFQEIPNANKIFLQGLQQLLSTAGVNGILSTTDKPSVSQVNLSKKTETRFIDRVYSQYEQACNIILSNMYYNGDLKYKWQFKVFGDIHSDSDYEAALVKDLGMGQKELFPKFLAIHDLSMNDADGICDWVDSYDIYSKFAVLVNSFTSSTNLPDKKNGRPNADENNIDSDGTAAAIDNGGNTGEARKMSLLHTCPYCEKEVQEKSECFPFCEEHYEKFIEENSENDEDGDEDV